MNTPTPQRIPVQVWTHSDVRSLKWGAILFGVGVGLFMPRGLRRYGRVAAVIAGAFAIKPLLAMLREDTRVCADRPSKVLIDGERPFDGNDPFEGAEAAD